MTKCLNSEEFQRYNRYIDITAKKEFLMDRYLLRSILGSYLGVDPAEVVLKKNEFGKLYLNDKYHQSDIYFNLSHSHGIVVGAFILEHDIGVDVEKIDGDIDDIVKRFFLRKSKIILVVNTVIRKRHYATNCGH